MNVRNDILLFQRIVPAYRVPFFKELYNKNGIITCHSKERNGDVKKSFYKQMDYRNEVIPRLYLGRSKNLVIQNIFPVLLKYKPGIVISQFSLGYLTFWLLLSLKPFFRYKLGLWSHGVRNNEIHAPFRSISRKLSLLLMRNADAVIFYSHSRQKIVANKLKRHNHLFVAPNTLDTTFLKDIYNRLSVIGKETIKNELGFASRFNLIFTGRLLNDKRIDLILDSFMILKAKYDISLHFIGEGPERERIEKFMEQSEMIHLHGGLFDELEVGKYLFASDIYIMPGYVGLGIVHAFSFGLPAISCRSTLTGPFHSPEAEYFIDNYNGFWCDSNIPSLVTNAEKMLSDLSLLNNMSKNALNTAYQECTMEKMLSGFERTISHLSS